MPPTYGIAKYRKPSHGNYHIVWAPREGFLISEGTANYRLKEPASGSPALA